MKLNGGIEFFENGMRTNIRAMHLQTEIMGILSSNFNGFDKVGYQRKDPVISSFSEYIGVHGLSTAIDDKVGRIINTKNPLDFAIVNKGYFQHSSPEGVKITRDGRFKLDREGYLQTLEGANVLSSAGAPIKMPWTPEKLEDIKVNNKGEIGLFNKLTGHFDYVATISVVTDRGIAVIEPDIKQGYNEHANVSLSTEIMEVIPVRRNFEANRIMFVLQNNQLGKAISELSK